MAVIRPFECVRPQAEKAERVAALPYDVYNREEACREVAREPLSFLKIDRAETQFDSSVDTYAPEVYAKAKELLDKLAEYKPLAKVEELEEQNYNMIDNVLNNGAEKKEQEQTKDQEREGEEHEERE